MFFKYAIRENKWFWAHLLLAAFMIKFVGAFFGLQNGAAFTILVAIMYEIVRFNMGEWKEYGVPSEVIDQITSDEIKESWQRKRYWLDALGDVIAVIIMIIIIVPWE